MNDFHARICDAQAQTNLLISAQTQFPSLCSLTQPASYTCVSFIQYTNCYYNQQSAILPLQQQMSKFPDYLPLLVILAFLALLWLLFLLLFCFCLCCPGLCPCYCPMCCVNYGRKCSSMIGGLRAVDTRTVNQKLVSSSVQDYPGFQPTKFDTHSHMKSTIADARFVNTNPLVSVFFVFFVFFCKKFGSIEPI